MKVTEPFGQIMRRRLSEFLFDIKYKKGNLNTKANALSKLQSLGRTTAALDEDIPAYPDYATLTQEQVILVPESNVLDHLLLLHGDLQNFALVSITIGEMLREQQADRFCRDRVA